MIVFFGMTPVLKSFLFSLIALFGAAQIVGGFSFGGDITVLLFAALIFGAVNSVLRPVLETIAIPLNWLTLGLFSIVSDAFLLYLVTRVVPGLAVTAFRFGGLHFELPSPYLSVTIPAFDVPVIGTLLVTSLVISAFILMLEVVFSDD